MRAQGDLINFYWILGDLDYGNMTEWLTTVLTEAEANNEKVRDTALDECYARLVNAPTRFGSSRTFRSWCRPRSSTPGPDSVRPARDTTAPTSLTVARTDAAIFSRFADTITGIFAGHTHNDQYVTIVDENNNPTAVPIPPPLCASSLCAHEHSIGISLSAPQVQYIVPSVTTFVGVNPSFRIWAYDRTTFEVVDYQQWNTNLTLANIVDDATYDTHTN